MRDVDLEAIEKLAVPLRRLRDYCRLHVEGLDNIPTGPAILVANHTGWLGLDYAMLCVSVYDGIGRIPRVAVHPSYYRLDAIRRHAHKLGFFEVSVATSTRILDEGGLVTFFPEAEAGNFKPFWKRYELQPFRPGFARVALASMAPIVPVSIVGGEDANPTLGSFNIHSLDAPVPIPLSILPLPAKWRIKVMRPLDPAKWLEGDSPDTDAAAAMARDVQTMLQATVNDERKARGHAFF